MEMTDDFSVLNFSPRTVVSLHRLLVIEDVHTDWAVGELLLRVPGVEMSHQVVFFVEVERANKTPELIIFLVSGLYVCQQEVGRGELLVTLRAGGGGLHLLAVPLTQVLVIQPLPVEYLMANVTGETFLHMEPLMLL